MSIQYMIQELQDQVDKLQNIVDHQRDLDTEYEKRKLYHYLGNDIVEILKNNNAIIAGGAITSLFTNKKINDIDVYFRSKRDIATMIEDIYEDSYIASHTSKATTFVIEGEVSIQIIHFKEFGNIDEIFDSFDFTVCMGAFDFKNEQFYLHPNFLKHNAQSVLKFHKGTSFPLMSLIRVGKYVDKGYTISRSEMFKIILACMNLDLDSYDKLKEHMSGMYGQNLDVVFNDIKDEKFDLNIVIDKLDKLYLSDDCFEKPNPISINNVDELIHKIVNEPIKYFVHNNIEYRVALSGRIEPLLTLSKIPKEEINIDEAFNENTRLYKYVQKIGDKLVSHFDNQFEYSVGEVAIAENETGLYFNNYNDLRHSTYYGRDDNVLIEVSVNADDFIGAEDYHLRFRKCKVLRVVDQ